MNKWTQIENTINDMGLDQIDEHVFHLGAFKMGYRFRFANFTENPFDWLCKGLDYKLGESNSKMGKLMLSYQGNLQEWFLRGFEMRYDGHKYIPIEGEHRGGARWHLYDSDDPPTLRVEGASDQFGRIQNPDALMALLKKAVEQIPFLRGAKIEMMV